MQVYYCYCTVHVFYTTFSFSVFNAPKIVKVVAGNEIELYFYFVPDTDSTDSGAQQDQYQDITTDLEAPDVSPQQPIISDPSSRQPLNKNTELRQPMSGGSVAPVQQLPMRSDPAFQPIRGSEAAPSPHDPRPEDAVHTGIEDIPISKEEKTTEDAGKIPVLLPENDLNKEIPVVEKHNSSKNSSASPTAVVVITPKSDKPVESAVQPADKLYPSSPSSSSSSSLSSPSSAATRSSDLLPDNLDPITDPIEDLGNNEQPPMEYDDQVSTKQENRDDGRCNLLLIGSCFIVKFLRQ